MKYVVLRETYENPTGEDEPDVPKGTLFEVMERFTQNGFTYLVKVKPVSWKHGYPVQLEYGEFDELNDDDVKLWQVLYL